MLIVWQVWLATMASKWLGIKGVGTLDDGMLNFNWSERALTDAHSDELWRAVELFSCRVQWSYSHNTLCGVCSVVAMEGGERMGEGLGCHVEKGEKISSVSQVSSDPID